MNPYSEAKSDRVLHLYARFISGEILKKSELAQEFHVTERSIQRDLESLRCFLAEQGWAQDIVYDRSANGYRLTKTMDYGLSNNEVLAVCKILLESRSMVKDEMLPILDKLVECCVPKKNQEMVRSLIANEKYHYIEPHHGARILNGLWELGQAVQEHRIIEIEYRSLKREEPVHRVLEPVGIMFSEFYFYLVGFIQNIDRQTKFENPEDSFPTIYRIDRIQSFTVTDKHFSIPYTARFKEGEFRKRVQFMYGGKLQTVHFTYSGPSVESVLDRLPTAEILEHRDGVYTIKAEVFGNGIEMWLRSQGDYVKMVERRR